MISVIVPVYKVEKYLQRCVDSILAQTEGNFELILVDDGSPDQCGKICDDYALKDGRVTVIHKENGGLSDARNAGLKIAKGDYTAFVDSDDWLEPEYLEILLQGIEGADICECGIFRTDGNDVIQKPENPRRAVYSGQEALKNLINDHLFHQYVWNKLYRTEVIKGVMFEKGKTHEDEFWTYQVFGNSQRVAIIDDILYNYFQRPDSIMGTGYSLKRLDGLEAKEKRQNYLEERYPQLALAGKRNMLYSCAYAGQMTLKYLEGDEKAKAMGKIDSFRNKCRIGPGEAGEYSLYEKTWFFILSHSFWMGCRLRNLLKLGF